MQTGLSVREFCIQIVDVLLYVTLYLIGALGILVWNNPLLVLPRLLVKRLHLHYDLVHAGNSTPKRSTF